MRRASHNCIPIVVSTLFFAAAGPTVAQQSCPNLVDVTNAEGARVKYDVEAYIKNKGSLGAALDEVEGRLRGETAVRQAFEAILSALNCRRMALEAQGLRVVRPSENRVARPAQSSADAELARLRQEREERIARAERESKEREDAEFQAALRENERDDREMRRQERADREARNQEWMNTMGVLAQQGQTLRRQQDEQNARRETERSRIEADNARYRQQRAEEDRRWMEQNQRQQQALVERQRAEQEYERQRREQAMAQQREAQAGEQRRQQAEQLRREQEQQRAQEESRRRQQLAEDTTPRVESLWRDNVYYLRNNGSRRVMCQVSGMVSRGNGIGPQTGLESFQKAVVVFPGSEEAPFSGPVANPRFFGCRVM